MQKDAKNMKALLIYPTPVSVMPYGILYIADVCRRNNFDTRLLVNTFKKYYSQEDIIKIARDFDPSIIGLSFPTLDILNVYSLIAKLKENSRAVIVCGGPHPSSRPHEVMNNNADIVVIGEGELTTDALCKLFSKVYQRTTGISLNDVAIQEGLETIEGIAYIVNNRRINQTSPRKRNPNLDELPHPGFDLLDREAFTAADGTLKGFNKIENGRGCPNQCTFCDRSVFGNRYVYKSSDRILDVIRMLNKKYAFTDFYFTDDTFTLNKKYVHEVCDKLLSADLKITWSCATRVNAVDLPMLSKMKEAGCRRIIFGVESGDNDWLRRTRKGFTVDIAIKALNLAHEVGIPTHVNLMYGFPWETPTHIENQIAFVKKMSNKVELFQTYGALIPYPNTAVFEEYAGEYNLEGWWLRERYQNCGQVIYQNVLDPYKLSTFYHRNLHDDTYVYEDYFFKFSNEYKKKVRELGFLLGKRNLTAQYKSSLKKTIFYYTGVLSRYMYEVTPNLEKNIISKIGLTSQLHDFRKIGEFIRK